MRLKRKIINLFDDSSIYNVKRVVSIDNEEDLNLFWDYLQNSSNDTYELIDAFITHFYNFALSYICMKDSEFFEIILEESDKNLYFTLWNKKIALLFQQHIQDTTLTHLAKNNRISIKLKKTELKQSKKEIDLIHTNRENKLISSTNSSKIVSLKPYDFIDSEDLSELLKLNEDMQELIFIHKKYGFDESSFISLRSIISMFCLTLRYYNQLSPISTVLTNFSNLLNTNKNEFLKLHRDELELIHGFINNIDTWLKTLFIKGGADIYFMDNSINADFQMISQIIDPVTLEEEGALDDIFDF
ncbi:MAG: hypothetical protein U9P38_06640 [Campylobacterota bacterium]|nr:hypothetical protein [Campylobacterota bacterium]